MKILITGASRGIGAATARNFGRSGDTELFIVSRNREALENLKSEIKNANGDAKVHVMAEDLSSENNIISLLQKIRGITQSLDILINNAGYLINNKFENITLSEINNMFQVNYLAPALLIRESIGLLKKSNIAHIVNISSMGGFQGSDKFPGLSHYSASKAAIASLTECLATEFKGKIKVNCLAIGSVQTEMLEEAFPGYQASLEPDEMAEFIYDFATKAGKYLNGKIIPVASVSP